MRSQLFFISAPLFLTTVVSGIPALKLSGIEEYCGVTTVYVTVAPTSSTTAVSELQETSALSYGDVSTPVSAISAESDVSASVSGPSIGVDSNSTTLLTSTVHRTVFLTNTVTGAGYTRTETIEVTHSTSSSALLDSSVLTFTTEENTHSGGIFVSSSYSSVVSAQYTGTALDSYIYPTFTVETRPKCSGDLVICPETSILNSLSSSSIEDVSVTQSTSSTSAPPEVYVIETLTVIPLESTPSASTGSILSTGSVAKTTSTSAITAISIDSSNSIPVLASVISTTALRTAALISSSRGYSSIGSGCWNLSIISSSIISGMASVGTASSTTLAVDALQSTLVTFNASTMVIPSSSNSSLATVTSSRATWTESCSEDISATSTANAEKYTLTSTTAGSNISSSSAVFTSSRYLWNIATISSSVSSSGYVASGEIMSSASYTAQSTSSGLATTVISSASSASAEFSSESSFSLIVTSITAMMNTSSSIITLFSTRVSPAISSGTSEASPLNVTSSSLLSTSSPQTIETEKGNTSLLSLTTYSQSPLTTTFIQLTSTIYSSQAEDNCTDSLTLPSYSATSLTLTSSLLTFTTATSSVSSATTLNATSVSSSSTSSPQPSVCGEQGAFTLNFDDIPPLAVNDSSTADPMPLFSPYHQFFFSDGWTIVPPPTDPYLPSSGQLLVEFLADPDSALGYTGAVGNGENSLLGCFNFNALGMSLGCDSKGPNCDWQFTGLRYNNVTKGTDTVTSQMVSTAACAALSNCTLVPIFLESTFQNLTELRINVTVLGVEKIWWLDDLNLAWFDDSCDAGLCRGGHN